MVSPGLQEPPEHCLASTTLPPSQRPAEQTVPSGCFWHLPDPSHIPFPPQLLAGSFVHWPATAGGDPAGTGEQLPILPGTLHAKQPWVQGPLQQTPSTQLPETHSLAHAQAA